jgi:hypothetical protein
LNVREVSAEARDTVPFSAAAASDSSRVISREAKELSIRKELAIRNPDLSKLLPTKLDANIEQF